MEAHSREIFSLKFNKATMVSPIYSGSCYKKSTIYIHIICIILFYRKKLGQKLVKFDKAFFIAAPYNNSLSSSLPQSIRSGIENGKFHCCL